MTSQEIVKVSWPEKRSNFKVTLKFHITLVITVLYPRMHDLSFEKPCILGPLIFSVFFVTFYQNFLYEKPPTYFCLVYLSLVSIESPDSGPQNLGFHNLAVRRNTGYTVKLMVHLITLGRYFWEKRPITTTRWRKKFSIRFFVQFLS